MSKTMFEILKRHLLVCQVYFNKYVYMFELCLKETMTSVKDIINSSLPYNEFTQHVTEQIGDIYADV